jgi:hypothetical protein
VEGKLPIMKDLKLVVSDDYFKTYHEPTMSDGRTVPGMISLAAVHGFVLAAAKAQTSKELALFVTKDGTTWHRAEFDNHRIEEDAYTVLESTNYSIQVDVKTILGAPVGVLFTSNSNGTYFTRNIEHLSVNDRGLVDFEKLQNIQGIYIVNTVVNYEEVETPVIFRPAKNIKSKITFDDGRTFESMEADGEELHLHSVTEQRNSGRIFSSPAPGIVMAIGNTGEYLTSLSSSSVFVSDDAGKSWIKTSLNGPHKYEFGDQGSILLAFPDSRTESDKLSYSFNHGRDWQTVKLPKGIAPYELTTVPDSTSLTFMLTGTMGDKWVIYNIDFTHLRDKCSNGDFEDWYARKNDKGEPKCIMGHTQSFRRRKADANCFIGDTYKEALPENKPCDCTDADFECDYNFRRSADGKSCELAGKLQINNGQCKKETDKFQGSSGWRLIPGNNCKRTGGHQLDDQMERPCSDVLAGPADTEVKVFINEFTGSRFASTHYLERDLISQDTDETIVFLTNKGEVHKTHDHGKTWDQIDTGPHGVVAIYPHSYSNDYVYFITPSRTVYYSENRAKRIHEFEAPDVPNIDHLPILSFHQRNPDWILWTGDQDCGLFHNKDCHVTAHMSKKNGAKDSWSLLQDWVRRCQFMYREGRAKSEDMVFCEHWQAQDPSGSLELLSSEDAFGHSEKIFDDVVDFATMSEFIVVAAKTKDNRYLTASASIDAREFAHAEFPPNFPVEHEQAYTVLDSSTNAVFLHVTENAEQGREYGPLLKSNSNGTSYVLSIRDVNRDTRGYVDFEKMQGLEGVAMVNVVSNARSFKAGDGKKLKTMITHDDGSDWTYLPCPEKNLDGQSYSCSSDLSKKSLHLHGYTERKDPRDTFSSPSAVGLMVGVGNVGEYLEAYNEGDTFLTKDGGITWKMIRKGTYMWEYGDQGSIIVMVERESATNQVIYTTDEGDNWHPLKFSEEAMTIERITTVPSDNSRNFLLWARSHNKLTTVNIDFSGLTDNKCRLDKEHPEGDDSDYYLWSPIHPIKKEEPDCLFGHKARYYRKKPESLCYNGPMIERLHDIERNCSCTRQDFEW